ncbi:glycosyltransferase [Chitinophaga flava]|uniref:Glycosyl transferase n=1 Tax=Chitinophaga flava TaxID=2259036 RepID=A0A365XWG6_9BACT|nr:glycosyltransferase [Chitinophaga flava]RBL90341.1 glycosyl transferase [Chitinophaga flava]
MSLAPIALFVFNRADKTQKTIAHLLQNAEAPASDIYIFSDGPRSEKDVPGIREVREYLKTVTGFKSVTVIEQEVNRGVSGSIVPGVTMVVNKHGKVIQIDDDMLVVPHFLKFMNDALDYYENDDRVACICGLLYPVKKKVPPTFFIRGADCAVWATWKRAWDLYEPDGQKLLNEIEKKKLSFLFEFHGSFPYIQMLKDQIAGRNDSWAVRWYASAFLHNKYTLYPGESLVKDNGRDDSGTNCTTTSDYDNIVGSEPIPVGNIPVKQSRQGFNAFKDFFVGLHKYPSFKRKRKRFKRWVKYLFTGA